MNRVLINLVREGNCFLWNDFIKEFKTGFRSLPFGLLSGVVIIDVVYTYQVLSQNGLSFLFIMIGIVLPAVMIIFLSYVFVFIPCLDLKVKDIAKNAFIFLLSETRTNLIILGSTLFLGLIVILTGAFPLVIVGNLSETLRLPIFPLVLLIFIYFSLNQLIICTAINQPMQDKIIGPYQEDKRKDNNHGKSSIQQNQKSL